MENRRTKECPADLKTLIDRYNLHPEEVTLQPLSIRSDSPKVSAGNFRVGGKKIEDQMEKWTVEARYGLGRVLEDKPWAFAEYIWGQPVDHRKLPVDDGFGDVDRNKDYGENYTRYLVPGVSREILADLFEPTIEAVKRYEEFDVLKFNFDRLIEFSFRHPSWAEQFEDTKREEKPMKVRLVLGEREKQLKGSTQVDLQIPLRGQIRIGKEGQANLAGLDFYDAIKDVDIRRIRRCERRARGERTCRRILWAGRIENLACQKTCEKSLSTYAGRESNST